MENNQNKATSPTRRFIAAAIFLLIGILSTVSAVNNGFGGIFIVLIAFWYIGFTVFLALGILLLKVKKEPAQSTVQPKQQ